jgi:hypothetical protein
VGANGGGGCVELFYNVEYVVQALLLQVAGEERHGVVALRQLQQRAQARLQHVVVFGGEQKEQHFDVRMAGLAELRKHRESVGVLSQTKHNAREIDELLALGQMRLLARRALEQFKYEGERRLASRKRGCDSVRPHERAEDYEGAQLEVVAGSVVTQRGPQHEALHERELEQTLVPVRGSV